MIDSGIMAKADDALEKFLNDDHKKPKVYSPSLIEKINKALDKGQMTYKVEPEHTVNQVRKIVIEYRNKGWVVYHFQRTNNNEQWLEFSVPKG